MIRIDQIKLQIFPSDDQLRSAAAGKLHISPKEITDFGIIRRSLDARKKPDLYHVYSLWVKTSNESKILSRFKKDANISHYEPVRFTLPSPGTEEIKGRVIVTGMGPAGLFCAYELALAGYKPLLIERGRSVDKRKEDVEKFWETGVLDTTSNVQFGEGGAGTFSDGKLSTSIKDKSGRIPEAMKIFVENGAPEEILYEQMPHLGTDILPGIVKNIRNRIIELGGEVRFETRLTGITADNGKLTKAILESKGNTEEIESSLLILATGHSARDTYKMLFESGLKMEQKPFAAGFRVQHPQRLINADRYGSDEAADKLGASPYKVTANFEDRGVFSFCMCPGGYVVNSSSEEGQLVVNGMSYSGRSSANANSAIVVSIPTSLYPTDHPLAGIDYQTDLEKKAYELGQGKIPAEKYGDFKKSVVNETAESGGRTEMYFKDFAPEFKGDYAEADLTGIFSPEINELFVKGMTHFGQMIKGFDDPKALMAGVESRTSSPVRIPRDNDSLEASITGIFPIGEGAGYAGGITSAAADGIRCAQSVIERFAKP